ncbi:MAG: phosphopentomutase [Candidatus Gastranaerophilales bacterium]|nr:phosphopentomutase [Candidatus Gastranaerophilales bacterium]
MKRVCLIVIDSMGIGALSDAFEYGDPLSCNTLVNVAKFNDGLNLPNFKKLGLGNITKIEGVNAVSPPLASYGIMKERSAGKDTTTGHWELAGLVLKNPFRTYPEGFPHELIERFIKETECKAILGNYPASGTAIIDELGDEHIKTGFPIIYTSADSVFQIACHVDTIPLDILYKWCEIARKILDDSDYNVSRVIARPFEGNNGCYKRISAARRDYSVPPTDYTILNSIEDKGGMIIGIGKIEDIYVKSGITHAVHTGSNLEGLKLTIKALKEDLDLDSIKISSKVNSETGIKIIFVNLVDTDMLYGHRNDPAGYGKAIEEIDSYLPEIINSLTSDDLLIITADHGCDPTVPGTDHTREQVPVLIYNPEIKAKNLGGRETFADVAATISEWLNVPYSCPANSMLS